MDYTKNMVNFLDSAKNDDYFEVIYRAEQEALKAERIALGKKKPTDIRERNQEYADALKNFIIFMRHGILPRRDKTYLPMFSNFRENQRKTDLGLPERA